MYLRHIKFRRKNYINLTNEAREIQKCKSGDL